MGILNCIQQLSCIYLLRWTLQIAAGKEPEIDPVAAKKAAEEAEERRLAEIRSLGTPVTPEHFSTWKKRFYVEMALARSRCCFACTRAEQCRRLSHILRAYRVLNVSGAMMLRISYVLKIDGGCEIHVAAAEGSGMLLQGASGPGAEETHRQAVLSTE